MAELLPNVEPERHRRRLRQLISDWAGECVVAVDDRRFTLAAGVAAYAQSVGHYNAFRLSFTADVRDLGWLVYATPEKCFEWAAFFASVTIPKACRLLVPDYDRVHTIVLEKLHRDHVEAHAAVRLLYNREHRRIVLAKDKPERFAWIEANIKSYPKPKLFTWADVRDNLLGRYNARINPR